MPSRRPTLFIGSSTEGLPVAEALQVLLHKPCEVTLWNQGVFALGSGYLESLVAALPRYDFAVLVLTPDDLILSRTAKQSAPRDNVLFELGLFMGGLGRDRTFALYDRTQQITLPSDLSGVVSLDFVRYADGNLQGALGACATQIASQIDRLGKRDLRELSKAAREMDVASAQMQKLVQILARSRKMELRILTVNFSPILGSEDLREIHKDIADLESSLTTYGQT